MAAVEAEIITLDWLNLKPKKVISWQDNVRLKSCGKYRW